MYDTDDDNVLDHTYTDTNMAADNCVDGEYCPVGSIIPQRCEPGEISYNGQPTEAEMCDPCPYQHFCPKWGMVEDEEWGDTISDP